MGMIQAKCPRCKKKRRKAEPLNTAPAKRWKYFPGIGRVCYVCAKQLMESLSDPSRQ